MDDVPQMYEKVPLATCRRELGIEAAAAAAAADKFADHNIYMISVLQRTRDLADSEQMLLLLLFSGDIGIEEFETRVRATPTCMEAPPEVTECLVQVVKEQHAAGATLTTPTLDIYIFQAIAYSVQQTHKALAVGAQKEKQIVCFGNTNLTPEHFGEALGVAMAFKRTVRFVRWGVELPRVPLKELLTRNVLRMLRQGRYVPAKAVAHYMDLAEELLKDGDSHQHLCELAGYEMDANGYVHELTGGVKLASSSEVTLENTPWKPWFETDQIVYPLHPGPDGKAPDAKRVPTKAAAGGGGGGLYADVRAGLKHLEGPDPAEVARAAAAAKAEEDARLAAKKRAEDEEKEREAAKVRAAAEAAAKLKAEQDAAAAAAAAAAAKEKRDREEAEAAAAKLKHDREEAERARLAEQARLQAVRDQEAAAAAAAAKEKRDREEAEAAAAKLKHDREEAERARLAEQARLQAARDQEAAAAKLKSEKDAAAAAKLKAEQDAAKEKRDREEAERARLAEQARLQGIQDQEAAAAAAAAAAAKLKAEQDAAAAKEKHDREEAERLRLAEEAAAAAAKSPLHHKAAVELEDEEIVNTSWQRSVPNHKHLSESHYVPAPGAHGGSYQTHYSSSSATTTTMGDGGLLSGEMHTTSHTHAHARTEKKEKDASPFACFFCNL